MESMVKETGETFKDFEKKTYEMFCRFACEYTRDFLEKYDEHLMQQRDKRAYRSKGIRSTTVKTIYGEVTYKRRLYRVTGSDGINRYCYLLDEQLKIPGVGLISLNLAEQMVQSITELSYRETAEQISSLSRQSISQQGVWNVIQALGEKECEEEKTLVKEHKAGRVQGKKETGILFEEADGVYLSLQREKQRKKEMKVGIVYDGWKEVGKERYELDGKVAIAGFMKTSEFQERREALIAQEYNLDEVNMRIMNADGAAWTKSICQAETVFQLDPFHKHKAILQNISHKQAGKAIRELLQEKDIDGALSYIETYQNSLSDEKEIEKAGQLLQYFRNNKEGLIAYKERNLPLPEETDLCYRTMGTMENHIWSIIAKRMKHRHASWSIKGGNHLAKILAKKCCGKLYEVTEKLKTVEFEPLAAQRIEEEIFSAAKIKERNGHGYRYPAQGSLQYLFESPDGNAHSAWARYAGM